MAPAQIPVFLSQKPSTKNVIIRPAILLLAWTDVRKAPQEYRGGSLKQYQLYTFIRLKSTTYSGCSGAKTQGPLLCLYVHIHPSAKPRSKVLCEVAREHNDRPTFEADGATVVRGRAPHEGKVPHLHMAFVVCFEPGGDLESYKVCV